MGAWVGSLGLVRYVCYVYVCNAVWDHWVRRGQGVHSFYCMGSLPSACRIVPYRIVPSGPACIRLHGIRSGPGLVVVYHLHWLYALGGTGVSGVMVVYGWCGIYAVCMGVLVCAVLYAGVGEGMYRYVLMECSALGLGEGIYDMHGSTVMLYGVLGSVLWSGLCSVLVL